MVERPESSDDEEPSPQPVHKETIPAENDEKPLKSILKVKNVDEVPKVPKKSRQASPPELNLSRGQKDKLAQDDAEIASLEKKLGLKGKKTSKAFAEDGLDFLLDGLDEDDGLVNGSGKRKLAEDEEWLKQKRRRVAAKDKDEEDDGEEDDSEQDLENDDMLSDEHELDSSDEEGEDGTEDDEGISDGFSSASDPDEKDLEDFDSDEEDSEPKLRVRENPYVAPTTGPQVPAAKYIPPSLRAASGSEAEAMQRLRRQLQGLLNRLSEANLLSILQSVEQVYQNNPRQHVTSTIIDLIVSMVCDKASLLDTFLILHAGFIAAIYKVIGTDFGAQVIERIVGDYDKYTAESASGKQTSNLISLLAELYNFQVVGCGIVFDFVRVFVQDLTEDNTELLLRIIRNTGHQLRQDDPTALKEIVILVQKSVSRQGEKNLSVRTKFMIETINNLKNNRMKTGVAASAVVAEHTTRMKKTLGSLNSRSTRSSEPLRINLADIRDAEKKGKWWLVGASYSDPAKLANNDSDRAPQQKTVTKPEKVDIDIEDGTVDLLQLAREQRMNTDIRRAIFITIMSATDFKDANLRLLKLNLKRTQMLETPRVLVHCCAAEASYNPYYTLIARKLCGDKKLGKAFQFALWDLFKKMGERDDEADSEDEEEDGEGMNTRKTLSLAKMFAALISDGGLPITVLKNLNFAYLQPKTQTFVEILLTTVIIGASQASSKWEQSVSEIISKAHEVPEMIQGLRYFLETVVARSELVTGKAQRKALSSGCKTAIQALTQQS